MACSHPAGAGRLPLGGNVEIRISPAARASGMSINQLFLPDGPMISIVPSPSSTALLKSAAACLMSLPLWQTLHLTLLAGPRGDYVIPAFVPS